MAENNLTKSFSDNNEEIIAQRFDPTDNTLSSQTVYLTYENQFNVQQNPPSSYVLPVTILNNDNSYLFYNNPIDTDLDQLQNKETVPQYIVNLDGSSKLPSTITPSSNTVLVQNVDRLQEMYSRFPLLNKLLVKRIYTRNLLSIDKAIQELDKLHKVEENKRKNIRLVYKQPKKETTQISRTTGDENLKYLVLSSKPFERMSTNLYKKVVIHDNNVFDCNTNSEPTIIEDFIKGRCKAFVSDEINGVIQEDPKGVVIKNESVAYKTKNEKVTATSDAGSIFPWRNKFIDDKSSDNSNTPMDSSNFLYPIYKEVETDLCDLDCDVVKPTGFLNDLCIPETLEIKSEDVVKNFEASKEPKFFRTKRLGDLELKKRTYVTKELSHIRSEKKLITSENSRKRKKYIDDDEIIPKQNVTVNDIYDGNSDKKLPMSPIFKNKYKDMLTSEEKDIFLKFFNQCTVHELSLMPGCSMKIAEKICSQGPFLNINDLNIKIKNLNIVNDNFIQNCHEVLNMRNMFSKLIVKCEQFVSKVENIIDKHLENNYLELSSNLESKNFIAEIPNRLNPNLKLKPFQLVGLNWLNLLYKEKINGILADESGLGKTVQIISFLAHLLDLGDQGPHLIIVPNSSIAHWESELKLWCPQMKFIIYHGSQDERKSIRLKIYDGQHNDFNVLLTTYNISTGTMEDRAMMKRVNFHYGIFDEAQMLKNMMSNRYKNLINFKVKRRLLLTGLPFQNNLLELISLLSFLMPEMFLPHSDFLKKIFQMNNKRKDEFGNVLSEFDNEKIEQTKNLLKPFCLKRLKENILNQLSAKTTDYVFLNLTHYQKMLYSNVVTAMRQGCSDEQRNSQYQMIMDLRKLCNHPLLLRNHYTNEILQSISNDLLQDKSHESANPKSIYEDLLTMNDFQIHITCQLYSHAVGKYSLGEQILIQSNKFQYLDKYLPDLMLEGHRVLIFSQIAMMIDVLEAYLNLNKYSYLRLDEQTPVCDKKDLAERFNKDESIKIFILSTKGECPGISLTGADTVIIHDVDFNPINNRQAEDMCHTLGQTKNIRIIKLISKDTIEETILSIANNKLKMEISTVNFNNFPEESLDLDEVVVGESTATINSQIKFKTKERKVQFQISENDDVSRRIVDKNNTDFTDTNSNDIEQLINSILMQPII